MQKFKDDKFVHLESDVSKIRTRHRQYISFSNAAAGLEICKEILYNALDECKNPRSPANKIHIEFDDRDGFIVIEDNGRGIPTDILEKVYTSLNMGSNIDTTDKAGLNMDNLGLNGVGSLATCALAERVVIRSNRGGTENKYKELVFEEGQKVDEYDGKCSPDKHGMYIRFKPSKVMGKDTKIVWNDVHNELLNLQFLNQKNIVIDSVYTDAKGNVTKEKYKQQPFPDILTRNKSDTIISPIYSIHISDKDLLEDLETVVVKRYIDMDIAFQWTSSLDPYIDSFSNSNNTVDNGDHLEAAIESLCRFFQVATRNSMSDREKDKLDIKWDDVKSGLSIAVSLRCNFENMYTGQTKHKVVNDTIRRAILDKMAVELQEYFSKNQGKLKSIIEIIKTNARARREGEKVKTAVIKNNLTNWSAFKMKGFDPCTNKGKAYKELFIVEGDSARGSLKQARDPRFQALYGIRGVSLNVFRVALDQIIGKNGNKEFTDLTTIFGCNVGAKFDINKLNYDKIIIASDADTDGYFIRSLLLAFFFKIFPEIVAAGRIYIAEPPLYRVSDKKNPFVVNMADYLNRYVSQASKEYRVGFKKNVKDIDISWLDKKSLSEFLDDTKYYVKDIIGEKGKGGLVGHYKVNSRLLEMVFEECVLCGIDETSENLTNELKKINIQHMMDRIGCEFSELFYDDKDNVIRGSIDSVWQELELCEGLIKMSKDVIRMLRTWMPGEEGSIVLRNIKTNAEHELSLLGTLMILQKFQPDIEHRFKGLGENDSDDIKTTIMNPNTRSLIRVNINDFENDMRIFQILRGGSQLDMAQRRAMLKAFEISPEDIDT